MKITDEMFETFCKHAGMSRSGWPNVRDGLKAALADVPEPGGEWTEADYATANRAYNCASPYATTHAGIHAALDAVKHRLGAPAVEPLSEYEEADLRHCEQLEGDVQLVCKMLRKRFPKPAPVQRTPRELAAIVRPYVEAGSPAAMALAALESRAK